MKPKIAEKSDSTHPKRQHESTRERVLEAAFTLFCEHGFSDVSLLEIATRAPAPITSTSQHKPQSQERNPTPKAESAFSQLSQWLNRTLRSIVPKTLEELFA